MDKLRTLRNEVEEYYRSHALRVTSLATFFCLVGVVHADLSTMPPLNLSEEQSNSNQAQIENLLVKARTAISKKRFSLPKNNNALDYLDQLLSLSPDNKPALKIVTELYDIYTVLAYKKLDINNTKLAQKYHNKAEKTAHQFNINIDSQALIDLQNRIDTRRMKRHRLNVAAKASISARKIEQRKQMMAELADLQREMALDLAQIDYFKAELKTRNKVSKSPSKTGITTQINREQETSEIIKENSFLSSSEREKIVVIVNKKNNISSLTLSDLKSLYKEQKKTWSNGEIVTLYLPSPDSDAFLWLARHVFLKKTSAPVIQFYKKGINRSKLKMPVTSTNSVLDVSRTVGSIAIVKEGEAEGHDSIKIVSINGT